MCLLFIIKLVHTASHRRAVIMTTLDDKILGEKLQYYYSSSEDEGSDNDDEDGENKTIRDAEVTEPEIDYSADGSAVNTGCTNRCSAFTGKKKKKIPCHKAAAQMTSK